MFSPLQGLEVEKKFDQTTRNAFPDSIVVWISEDQYKLKSDAVIFILQNLGGVHRIFGSFLQFFPAPLRDFTYDCIARVRKKIFGEKTDTCPLLPDDVRKKFTD